MMVPSGESLSDYLAQRLGGVLSRRRGVALAAWGESGIGKTWAVGQTLQNLACRSAVLEADAAYGALLSVLPKPPRLAVWAERSLERLARGELSQEQASTALAALLSGLAPFVLVVEDLHQSSPERLELWQKLAEAVLRSNGVALLATSRAAPPEPFEAVRLGPLGLETCQRILEEQTHLPLPLEATRWIYARAQGNPLFTLEYFRHLAREGYLWSDGKIWRWRQPSTNLMPDSVEALIAHSLSAALLSPLEQRVLQARAFLGQAYTPRLLGEILALSPEELALIYRRLEQAGVLEEEGFVHPLFREVACQELPPQQRRAFARSAIAALAEQPQQALEFLPESGLEPGEALALLDRAIALSDAHRAAHWTAQKIAYTPASERAALALSSARQMQEYSLSRALELVEQALGDPEQHLEAALLKAVLLSRLGRGAEAETLLWGLPKDRLQWLETLIQVRHNAHDYIGVLTLWEERPDDFSFHARALAARSLVQLRRLEEARALFEELLAQPISDPFEYAHLLYFQSFIPQFAGQYAEAEAGFTRFLERLETLDDGSARFQELRDGALQLRAYARNALERPGPATDDIQAALRRPAESGNGSLYAFRLAEYGLYQMEQGHFAQAEDAVTEALGVMERLGHKIYLSWVGRIAARLYLEWASPHGAALALRHARASLQYARAAQSPTFEAGGLFVSAWAEALHGRPEQALAALPELRRLAEETHQPAFVAGADWVQGLALERMGRVPEARAALEQALAGARPQPLGPSPERMALELDRLNQDRASADRRVQRWRQQGMLSSLEVARRYFPVAHAFPADQVPLDPSSEVHLQVLGAVQIQLNGVPISDRNRKAKEMLALLLEARLSGRGEVGPLELYDALYPEMSEEKAVSALKQLVYRLRSGLGAEVVLRTAGGYALGAVSSDAEAFLNTGNTRLWRGTYMHGLSQNSASLSADSLYSTLRDKAQALASSQPKEAARLGQILLEADPYDTQALVILVRAMQGQNPKTLVTLYEQARRRMLEVGERLPEHWQDFLARHP
ncbi:MAG: hypothetical protein SFU83_10875 [Meiothermus sp.]|nr:hypothetical protein [Meiothermus sp.]